MTVHRFYFGDAVRILACIYGSFIGLQFSIALIQAIWFPA